MTDTLKVLGQSAPAANTLTDLYTVPALKSAVGSSLVICNQDGADSTFRVSVAVAGAVDSAKQYLFYDEPIDLKSAVTLTLGLSLATTDIVRVWSANGSCSFNLFGAEVS